MTVLNKTLTLEYMDMDLNGQIDTEDQNYLDIVAGKLGSVTTTWWNGNTTWRDIETTRPTVLGEKVIVSSTVNVNTAESNTLNIQCTNYYKLEQGFDAAVATFDEFTTTLCPQGYIHLTPLGGDQWRMDWDYDYRYVDPVAYNFFEQKFGASQEAINLLFQGELLFSGMMGSYERYQATKTFTWDGVTPLIWQLVEGRLLGAGSPDFEADFTQEVQFKLT